MPEPLFETSNEQVRQDSDVLSRDWVVSDTEVGAGSEIPPSNPVVGATLESEDPGQSSSVRESAPTLAELREKSAATFAQEKAAFQGILGTRTVNAVLERFGRQAEQSAIAAGNPYSQLGSEGAAALLLRVDELQSTNDGEPVNAELVQILQDQVETDLAASELYYTERFGDITKDQLAHEVATAAAGLAKGETVVGHRLRILLEKSSELSLASGVDADNELAEQLHTLREEAVRRKEVVVSVAQSILPEDVSVNPDAVADTIASNPTVVSNDGETIVVQSTTAEGEVVEAEIHKPDLVKLLFLMTLSDVLLGTKNLEYIGEKMLQAGVSPYLKKLGIDPEWLFDSIDSKKHEMFDQYLATMTDEQCEKFFSDSLNNKTLPHILEQCRPELIQKIFAANGTQGFRSNAQFFAHEHKLPQTLVDQMYDSLTVSQRAELHIPERQASPTT